MRVFTSRQPYLTSHADQDPDELVGIKEGLKVKSIVAVPLYVAGELRGVVQVDSLQPEAFSEYDLRFMKAVAGWIGTTTHRTELIEQIRWEAQEEARRAAAEELVTHDLGNYLTTLLSRVQLIQRQATKESHLHFRQDTAAVVVILKRLEKLVGELKESLP